MKNIPGTILILILAISVKSQTCDCEKEFLYIKNIVEQNFPGFNDRINAISRNAYDKKVDQFLQLSRNNSASDNCPLIIDRYLDIFKSHHLGFFGTSDPYRTDTDYVNRRPLYNITERQIQQLKKSTSWEGIYNFAYDSSTKIAVIKDRTLLHDYIGVTLESSRPTWKRGMIKFEGKQVNDSLLKGLLYMRNHRPKLESFFLWNNHSMISGDWRREGAPIVKQELVPSTSEHFSAIDAKKITSNTLFIKIASFGSDEKPAIDSLLKANETILNSIPNLILDLRDNGGGSDDSWQGIIPYLYTGPIKTMGADLLATEQTIAVYKRFLNGKNLSKENIDYINSKIARMESAKGKWIINNEDEIDSSYTQKLFPRKIMILINRWCGSSTEQLLLSAQQSSKVILAGENTIGNLDYSNIVEQPFACFPYTLVYPTTRSRRLNIQQGIDNVGIAPRYIFPESADWMKEALKILEHP